MAGFASTQQSDFSKGAHVGLERVPDNGVEDCVNGIYQDDGTIARRGGCTYLTTSDADSAYGDLRVVWSGQLVPGERVVALSSESTMTGSPANVDWAVWRFNNGTNVLDAAYTYQDFFAPRKWGRPTSTGGLLFVPVRSSTQVDVYGGAATAYYSVTTPNTVTVTAGSTAVTGSGTTFLANVEPGMILAANSPERYGVVESVTDNTNLVLASPWVGSTATGDASFVSRVDLLTAGGGIITAEEATTADVPCPVVASIFGRLILGFRNRVYFSSTTDPFNVNVDEDYHEFPEGVIVTGLEALRDSMLVFTTDGLWSISGLALDLTDDYGNTQHRVERLNRDLVLWRDSGIAGVPDGLVVPALDDIYALNGAGTNPIGGGIRKTYREYVRSGYAPGHAAVHSGHYILPILNPSSDDQWVDTLVCDLTDNAWSRWDGYGGKVRALTQRVRSGRPSLIATAGAGSSDSRRLTNMTDCFEPAAANYKDADASTHNLVVTFRTQISGTLNTLWTRFRLMYRLTDANSDNPTITADYQTGPPNNTWTSLTGSAAEAEDGVQYWRIGKRSKTMRVRVTSSGPSAKLVIRAAEWLYRQTGRK